MIRACALLTVLLASSARAQTAPDPRRAESDRLNAEMLQLIDRGDFAGALAKGQQELPLDERVFGAESREVAHLLNNLGIVQFQLDHYAEAEALTRRSLAIEEKILPPDDPDVAVTLNGLAMIDWAMGQHLDEGVQLARRALAIREKAHVDTSATSQLLANLLQDQAKAGKSGAPPPAPNDAEPATTLTALGDSLRKQNRYDEAEAAYRRALEIEARAPGPQDRRKSVAALPLAGLLKAEGKYADAEALYLSLQKAYEAAGAAETPDAVTVMIGLADLYRLEGQYNKFLTLSASLLKLTDKVFGPEDPNTALILDNAAMAFQYGGDYANAEHWYKQALAIQEKSLGPDHPAAASTIDNLATLYMMQDRFQDAEPLLLRALAVHANAASGGDAAGITLVNLAQCYKFEGRYAEAEPILRQVLDVYGKNLGPAAPETVQTTHNLAIVLWDEKKFPEALTLLARESAEQERRMAANLSNGSETQRLEYSYQFAGSTEILLSFQAAYGGVDARRLAWETVLRRKGRVLDSLAGELDAIRARLDAGQRQDLDSLTGVRGALASLYLQGAAAGGADAYRKTLDATRAREEELVRKLSASSPAFRAEAQPPTLAQVQAALPEGAALVEYALYRPFDPAAAPGKIWGPWRFGAFRAASSRDPAWVDLGEAAPIERLIEQWRAELARPGMENTGEPLARQLYAALVAPVLPQGETRTLLVAPDGALHLLPWAALSDPQGKFLLDRYRISLIDSGRDLLKFAQAAAPRGPDVILANPDFDGAAGGSAPAFRRSADMPLAHWKPLPATAAEAGAVHGQLGAAAQLFEGTAATKSALAAVHGPRVLHVATHGFFLKDQPQPAPENSRGTMAKIPSASQSADKPGENPLLRSGIVLAGANRPESAGSSILTALEAAQLDLQGTALVTLSACETGVGEVHNSEGVFGLKRAFAIAGAQAQLISLWEVDDKSTSELMSEFYAQLAAGSGRADALRAAQRKLAAEYRSPYYWAAFTLSGDPGPLPK
jgi:CHAT domain-containing protein/tetratricopeptide (TPR) repeat protein